MSDFPASQENPDFQIKPEYSGCIRSAQEFEKFKLEDCNCENVTNGCCDMCGRYTEDAKDGTYIDLNQGYTQTHQYTPVAKVLFEAEIKKLNIPEEVKISAIAIANSSEQKTHRNAIRREQIFAYVYYAFLQSGIAFNPNDVAKELGLDKQQINKAVQMSSGTSNVKIPLPIQNGIQMTSPVVVISAKTYIQSICVLNNIQEDFSAIYNIAETLLDNDSDEASFVAEQNPAHVAVAIVKLYLDSKGRKITQFAKTNKISDLVLKTRLNELKEVVSVLKIQI